jgi:hypothetical protein
MTILTKSLQDLKNLREKVLKAIALLQDEMVRCDYDEKKLNKLSSQEENGINNNLAELDLLISAIEENETSFRIRKSVTQADYLKTKTKLAADVTRTLYRGEHWVNTMIEIHDFAHEMFMDEHPCEGDYAVTREEHGEWVGA